jgi:hypothetical protein
MSQNNTNSPYTRLGYGETSDFASSAIKSMGGAAIANRSESAINYLNPASFSSIDSMTFKLDFGGFGKISRFTDNNGLGRSSNGNFEYVCMHFPLFKNIAFSAGMLPYSVLGYKLTTKDTLVDNFKLPNDSSIESKYPYSAYYSGKGGINQVYTGFSAKLFNHLSIGVNAYYMFGSINHASELYFKSQDLYNSNHIQQITNQNFRFRYGVQYFTTFASKHSICIGAIYENKASMNATVYNSYKSDVKGDTLISKNGFELPQTFGMGLTYSLDNKLTFSTDYTLLQWSNAQFFGKTDSLRNQSKIGFGTEFIPNFKSRYYFNRIRYRVGISITDPYYTINGNIPPKNYSITLGFGFPFRNTKSMVNTCFEYGKIGSVNLLQEDYFKFSISIVTNEFWFFKRKL